MPRKQPNWRSNGKIQLTELNEHIKQRQQEQRLQQWSQTRHNREVKRIEQRYRFKNDGLFIQAQFEYDNQHKLDNNTYQVLREDTMQCSKINSNIINKLRTEHCNLNNYESFYYKGESANCTNPQCNCIETVSHYLIDCPLFDQYRNKMRNSLCKIDNRFNNSQYFNAMEILFPHRWQINPSKDDKNYKQIMSKNRDIRVKIIDCICEYVIDTKRFDSEYGI